LRPKGLQAIPAGRHVRIDLPGGGGFGPPAERAPEHVARDLKQGYVTSQEADTT
jgi:N-methylhydantoinase B